MQKNKKGFSLIELLVAVGVIITLSLIVMVSTGNSRERARYARAVDELRQIAAAAELYKLEHGGVYPSDVDRNIPPGLEEYLGPGAWPSAPWPGSVYDWDSWTPSQIDYNPKEQVYQVSIRFCPLPNSPLADCKFPEQKWVTDDWDVKSAVYYCMQGPCRSNSETPPNHPGYCINCN